MEKIRVDNREYIFKKSIKDDDKLRKSFDSLSKTIFDLSFETWYKSGYWKEDYINYVLIEGSEVVSNVSVNKINLACLDRNYSFIQIGTVMTKKEHRKKGLVDYLLKKVLDDWEDKVDNIYLYANNSVLELYPKYGFKKAREYRLSMEVKPSDKKAKKVDMTKRENIEKFLEYYSKNNPYSKIRLIDNIGIVMFYAGGFLEDHIYYLEDLDLFAIVEYIDTEMFIYDIYGDKKLDLKRVVEDLAYSDTKVARFGFEAEDIGGMDREEIVEEDTQLFSLNTRLFEERIVLPFLSRA